MINSWLFFFSPVVMRVAIEPPQGTFCLAETIVVFTVQVPTCDKVEDPSVDGGWALSGFEYLPVLQFKLAGQQVQIDRHKLFASTVAQSDEDWLQSDENSSNFYLGKQGKQSSTGS